MRISDWSSDVCSSDLKHNIEQHYVIDGLSDDLEVPGTVDNIWLTKQIRVDRDYAAFGEVSFDITEQLTLTGGGRVYKFDNSLVGFFGYSNPGFSSNPVYACQGPAVVDGSPCTNLDKRTKKTDRSEEHTTELQSLMRISYAVSCLKKKK